MRKSKAMPILFFLVFLVGLSLLLYPMFADRWNQRRMDGVIENYVQTAEAVDSAQAQQWLLRAQEYNQTLEGKGVPDAFAETTPEEDSDYLSQLSFSEDGVMGYLEIPTISVSLPIYHGTGTESLSKGAGHLQGSALPVGGKSTHCVISAHRGLPSEAMFKDLDQLKEGDHFYGGAGGDGFPECCARGGSGDTGYLYALRDQYPAAAGAGTSGGLCAGNRCQRGAGSCSLGLYPLWSVDRCGTGDHGAVYSAAVAVDAPQHAEG